MHANLSACFLWNNLVPASTGYMVYEVCIPQQRWSNRSRRAVTPHLLISVHCHRTTWVFMNTFVIYLVLDSFSHIEFPSNYFPSLVSFPSDKKFMQYTVPWPSHSHRVVPALLLVSCNFSWRFEQVHWGLDLCTNIYQCECCYSKMCLCIIHHWLHVCLKQQ